MSTVRVAAALLAAAAPLAAAGPVGVAKCGAGPAELQRWTFDTPVRARPGRLSGLSVH